MSRGAEFNWCGLLFSTACSASQARALIGATTSKLAEPWRVGTALALRQCGASATSWNFTATALRVRRDAVNGAKSRVVASSTGPGAGTRPSHAVGPWIGPGTGGGSLDVLILSLIAQLCRLPKCLTNSEWCSRRSSSAQPTNARLSTASHESESAGQVVVAARSTARSCSPRRSSS